MARYAILPARPKAYIEHTEEGPSFLPYLEVSERGPVFTGLYDNQGNEVYRLPEPIGFHWD